MSVDEQLVLYLQKQGNTEKILQILRDNSLYDKFADFFVKRDANDRLRNDRVNRLMVDRNLCVALPIFSHFNRLKISYVTFKGFVLSQLLYKNIYGRQWGDIDFFVYPSHFEQAFSYLTNHGYRVCSQNAFSEQHHLVFAPSETPQGKDFLQRVGNLYIELHRSFLHPSLGIDENYLREHLQETKIKGSRIVTFAPTACMLHLLYHLYMDTALIHENLVLVHDGRGLIFPNRFLYRAYEIALFAEKFQDEIVWQDVKLNLVSQKITPVFSAMISTILQIFSPFPNDLFEPILSQRKM